MSQVWGQGKQTQFLPSGNLDRVAEGERALHLVSPPLFFPGKILVRRLILKQSI